MNSKNKISEAELEIMKIVWERQEAVASSDIVGICLLYTSDAADD